MGIVTSYRQHSAMMEVIQWFSFSYQNAVFTFKQSAGCCNSPIQFEKRVYLPKPTLNLLKTWFSREKPAEMSSKPGFC
jgi:hypothetical protein